MAKSNKITKKQLLKLFKASQRKDGIDNGHVNFRPNIEKSKKTYNRKGKDKRNINFE